MTPIHAVYGQFFGARRQHRCEWDWRDKGSINKIYNFMLYTHARAGPHVALKIIMVIVEKKKLYNNIYWSLLRRCRWVNQFAGARVRGSSQTERTL